MQTEAVMARYRQLGSNLDASIQVRKEFEERGQLHWHQMHEECWCGFLTVPTSFYEYDKGRQVTSQADVEKAYRMSLQESVPTPMSLQCEGCGERPREGRYRLCAACRKSAYRERSQ